MKMEHIGRKTVISLIALVFLAVGCAGSGWAEPRQRYDEHSRKHRPGQRVRVVKKTRVVRVGGAPYVYRQGHLWHRGKRGAVRRYAPPKRRFYRVLPRGAVRVVINGLPHFRIGAAFCLPIDGGYVRVDAPVRYEQPVVVTAPASSRSRAVVQGTENVTVMVINSNGSRTPVVLDRGEGGTWIGPNGEIYDRFPTLDQLKPVYGF